MSMMVLLLVINVILLFCFYIGFLFLEDESRKMKNGLKEIKRVKQELKELKRRLEDIEIEQGAEAQYETKDPWLQEVYKEGRRKYGEEFGKFLQ